MGLQPRCTSAHPSCNAYTTAAANRVSVAQMCHTAIMTLIDSDSIAYEKDGTQDEICADAAYFFANNNDHPFALN